MKTKLESPFSNGGFFLLAIKIGLKLAFGLDTADFGG